MGVDLATRREEILREMGRLAEEIMASLTNVDTTDDFDAREELWMERENLRAELARVAA
jgi:hypothetical protein